MRWGNFLLLWMATVGSGQAGGCIALQADRITAGDVAPYQPLFGALAPQTFVAYMPLAGLRRILDPAAQARIAARYQLGAARFETLCFEYPLRPLDAREVAAAIRAATGEETAEVEVLDFSRQPAPPGKLEFPRSGLRQAAANGQAPLLWQGRIRYAARRSFSVWARVRIRVRIPLILAARDIPAGQIIGAQDLRQELTSSFPPVAGAARERTLVEGMQARRSISAGAPVLTSLLQAPRLVDRGENVSVEVRSGETRLLLQAEAESGGRAGERILLRNPSSGKRFAARVTAPGKALVDTSPAIETAIETGSRP